MHQMGVAIPFETSAGSRWACIWEIPGHFAARQRQPQCRGEPVARKRTWIGRSACMPGEHRGELTMRSNRSLGIAAALAIAAFIGPAASAAQKMAPEQKPGYDKTKDVSAPAPKGADVPFDGTMKSIQDNWQMWPKANMPIKWSLVDSPTGGAKALMTNGGRRWGTHDLVTKKKYTDFEGHVDFILMGKRGDGSAEGYANSGVYLQNRYEIQIESPKGKNVRDPYNWKIGGHGIGAFCMEHTPDVNAWRPNGEWHAFHFIFTAARWEGDKCIKPARATVWWNGLMVHNNVPVRKANGGEKVTPRPEGLKLQEHGQDVRYRNIWILERAAEKKR